MINKIIRNFIAKQMAGRSDDGIMITLKDPQRVTLGENILADTLMRYGIDPAAITSEAQLKSILQQIKNAQAAEIRNTGIRSTQSAKVFNIEGQKLDPNKPIIGGTQEGKELSKELSDRLLGTNTQRIKQRIADKKIDDDLPPPGSRGGDDDIAAPVQSSEESLKNMIEAENKKNIAKMKNRKMLNEAIDDASPGFSGDRKVDAELVAENLAERMGLVYDDMPTKERLKLYDEAYQGITKKKFDPPEEKADGGRIGFSGGKLAQVSGRKFLEKVFGKEKFKEMATRDPEMYQGLLEVVDMYRKRDKEGLKMYLQKFLPHMDDEAIEDFIRGSDGTEGLVGELIRLGSGRDYAGKIELIKKAENMRKLDDLEITDKMIRKPNADGGIMRLGFKDGMNRRTFLKLLGGAMSIPIIGKIFKPLKVGKTVTKVPIIKTDNVPGKPEWFDQLVNKVILEGDDVTKRFATKERQIVHAKQIDEDNYVTVTQDLDEGAVVVEYESPTTMFGEKVDLRYKKPPPDEGDPRPVGEFQTEESGIVGRAQGPDDYDLEIEGMSGRAIEDLESDVSILKQYATGEKPTLKEIVQSKKRKDKVKYYETPEGQSEYVVQRQGEADDYYTDVDDFARGGIARMLGE